MARFIRFMPEEQSEVAFGSIGATYTVINSGFSRPMRQLIVSNLTDASLQFSFDGTKNHFPLGAGSSLMLDISANAVNEEGFFIGKGDQVYVKEIDSPTSGSVYVSAFYGGR